MKQGYNIFLQGLGDLIACYKTEQNKQLKEFYKGKIKEFTADAKTMQAYLRSLNLTDSTDVRGK